VKAEKTLKIDFITDDRKKGQQRSALVVLQMAEEIREYMPLASFLHVGLQAPFTSAILDRYSFHCCSLWKRKTFISKKTKPNHFCMML